MKQELLIIIIGPMRLVMVMVDGEMENLNIILIDLKTPELKMGF